MFYIKLKDEIAMTKEVNFFVFCQNKAMFTKFNDTFS